MVGCPIVPRTPLSPKDVQISLEPVDITLLGKRNSADVSRFRILRWRDYPDGPNIITKALQKGSQKNQGQKRRCDNRCRDWSDVAASEAGKGKEWIPPRASRRKSALPIP